MSGSEKRFTTVLLIISIIGCVVLSIQAVLTKDQGIVPILGLPHAYHMALFDMIIPVFGSAVFVLIFPRIFAPFYLRLKKSMMPHFKNGQVDFDSNPDSFKKWFTRSLFVALLVLGIQAALFGFFPFEAFLTADDLLGYQGANIDIRFTLGVTSAIVGLLTPLAIGVFSVSWALEDAGLVHYDLPNNNSRIYEIEPIFRRYTSYVKGYAGLSSILFLSGIVAYFAGVATVDSSRVIDAIITMILPLTTVLSTSLAYLVYVKTNTKFLRGKYRDIGTITEDEILS